MNLSMVPDWRQCLIILELSWLYVSINTMLKVFSVTPFDWNSLPSACLPVKFEAQHFKLNVNGYRLSS